MSTFTREELFDACTRSDVECLRRAAASGVALKTVTDNWQGYWQVYQNETLLHIASRYDLTLYTLWFKLNSPLQETAPILCSIILVMIDSVLWSCRPRPVFFLML